MNAGKMAFAQLMEFFPQYEFQKCVERYQGNYKIKSFPCWDQFLCMGFAQLTYRESLRDIQACLRGNQQKLYHMGFRGNVSHLSLRPHRLLRHESGGRRGSTTIRRSPLHRPTRNDKDSFGSYDCGSALVRPVHRVALVSHDDD